jgi:murein DD-endopeptidase MepM/ murein hydrolase activator NlpD
LTAPDTGAFDLTLAGPANTVNLTGAITEARLRRTIVGASTLDVTVNDARRRLLTSTALVEKSWVIVKGSEVSPDVPFELVGVRKAGDRVNLTFEDLIVAALRRQTGTLSIPAETVTWSQFCQQLADEAGVRALIEPRTEKVNRALERNVALSAGEVGSDSWRMIADGSEDRGLRAFSDGTQLVVGSDDWLAQIISPWTIKAEHQGPVHDIDFTLDVARKDNSATVQVDARLWSVMPGRMVNLPDGLGPASGRWLAESFERYLTRQRATVGLVRNRLVLPEPPPEALPVTGEQPAGVEGLLALTGIREAPGPSSVASTAPKPSVPQAQNPRQGDRRPMGGYAWPTYDKRVTSGFGPRKSPGGKGSTNHAGIDIGAAAGAQVFAARAGIVSLARSLKGYGNVVYIDHGNGFETRYAHLSRIDVSVGQGVSVGTQVGRVGSTGTATGPHLHFEVRVNGRAENPLNYLP